MSDAEHFVRTLRVAPRSDAVVLLTCFVLTVVFDMVVAVTVGVVLAALLFMRRMAEVSGVQLLLAEHHTRLRARCRRGVVLYEIAGPALLRRRAARHGRPAARGRTASRSWSSTSRRAGDRRHRPRQPRVGGRAAAARRVEVVLAGVQPQPLRALAKAGWRSDPALGIGTSFASPRAGARDGGRGGS